MASRLRTDRAFGKQVTRFASEELANAVSILSKRPEGIHKSIHEARRCFKRVRGLCRLVQAADVVFFKKMRADIGDLGQALSTLRDATALVESCSRQQAFAFHEDTAAAFQRLMNLLQAEHRDLSSDTPRLEKAVDQVKAQANRLLTDVDLLKIDFDAPQAAKILRKGWRQTLEKAQNAIAVCDNKPSTEAFHDLRKAAQSQVQQANLLNELWPAFLTQRQKEAKLIADLLGEDHDLCVLLDKIAIFENEHIKDRYLLEASIHERQAHLRPLALSKARALFAVDAIFEAERIALMWRHDARRDEKID